MRYYEFLKLLKTKQKLLFLTGAMLENCANKIKEFSSLKEQRGWFSNMQELGFNYQRTENFLLLQRGKTQLFLRTNTSDIEVFTQIFLNNEYLAVINCIRDNNIEVNTILDAGSNIGLTALKLAEAFPDANVICLEPDPENFYQLKQNTREFKKIVSLQYALWSKHETLFIDSNFRDGKHWGRTVSTLKSNIEIQAIPIDSLLDKCQIERIDFIKIDIEGSEKELFQSDTFLHFLNKLKIIAIEIHDEFNCRENINSELINRGFVLFQSGELTVGVNRNLL